MRCRVRKKVDDQDAHKNKGQPQNCRPVQPLPEHDKADQSDQYDAQARPDCIDDAHRHHPQRQTHQVKSKAVSDDDQNRRPEPRELLAGLKSRCSDRFGNDRQKKNQIGLGHLGFAPQGFGQIDHDIVVRGKRFRPRMPALVSALKCENTFPWGQVNPTMGNATSVILRARISFLFNEF